MKERERKRKRELGIDASEDEGAEEEGAPEAKAGKRQKGEEDADAAEARRRQKAEKRKEKREAKKQKQAKLKEKREAKKAAKQDEDLDEAAAASKRRPQKSKPASQAEEDDEEDDDEPAEAIGDSEMGKLDMSGLADTDGEDAHSGAGVSAPSTAPSSPGADSPAFDISTNHSTASSSSSIIPPSVAESDATKAAPRQKPAQKPETNTALSQQKPLPNLDIASATKDLDPTSGTSSPRLNLPNIDSEALQDRLRARLAELRTARKADGPDGKTPKSRQELLDQRRKKEEQRKAHKKELRRKAKEEESRKQEERLRGSGSPLSTDIFSPRPRDESTNNFSFSRLAFDDGSAPDASLTNLQDARKRKGPQDTRTALQAAEAKQQRLSGLDAEKRADIAEKDLWLNAKKRAHGERVRDDTSLLKKALKRQEKRKGKSAGEWKEREQAVVKGKEMKQKKREANLAKRKEEKKKGKPKGGGAGKKGKGRPGFEGRFKA